MLVQMIRKEVLTQKTKIRADLRVSIRVNYRPCPEINSSHVRYLFDNSFVFFQHYGIDYEFIPDDYAFFSAIERFVKSLL